MNRSLTISLLLTNLLVTSCISVQEPYQAPAQTQQTQWHGDLGGLSQADLDPAQLNRWWTRLNDPILNDLITRATTANLDLRSATLQLKQARGQRKIAQSGLLPTLLADGSAAHTGNGQQSSTLYSASFDASWELDLFGGNRAKVEAAVADLESAEESRRDLLVSLLAEVALNYTDLRSLQSRRAISQQHLGAQSEQLAINAAKQQAGAATELDLARARSGVSNVAAQLPGFDQQIDATKNHLALLLGLAPGTLHSQLDQPQPVPEVDIRVAVGVPAQVLRHRPDIRSAERHLAAETYRIGVTRAELYPQFNLTGTIGLESITSLLSSDSLVLGIIPGVQWNLFNGGRIRQQLETQTVAQEQALIDYQRTLLEALEEVENAITALAQEQLKNSQLKISAEAATTANTIANVRYDAGASEYLSVLDSQREALSAQEQLAVSSGQLTINLIRLYKALGGGWDSQPVQ